MSKQTHPTIKIASLTDAQREELYTWVYAHGNGVKKEKTYLALLATLIALVPPFILVVSVAALIKNSLKKNTEGLDAPAKKKTIREKMGAAIRWIVGLLLTSMLPVITGFLFWKAWKKDILDERALIQRVRSDEPVKIGALITDYHPVVRNMIKTLRAPIHQANPTLKSEHSVAKPKKVKREEIIDSRPQMVYYMDREQNKRWRYYKQYMTADELTKSYKKSQEVVEQIETQYADYMRQQFGVRASS